MTKENIKSVIGYTVSEVFVNEEKKNEFQLVCKEFLKEEICIDCPGQFDTAIAKLKSILEPPANNFDFENFDYMIKEDSIMESEFGPRTSKNMTHEEARIILTNRPKLIGVFVKIPKKSKIISPSGMPDAETTEVSPQN